MHSHQRRLSDSEIRTKKKSDSLECAWSTFLNDNDAKYKVAPGKRWNISIRAAKIDWVWDGGGKKIIFQIFCIEKCFWFSNLKKNLLALEIIEMEKERRIAPPPRRDPTPIFLLCENSRTFGHFHPLSLALSLLDNSWSSEKWWLFSVLGGWGTLKRPAHFCPWLM